jgi:hypothetical protein
VGGQLLGPRICFVFSLENWGFYHPT